MNVTQLEKQIGGLSNPSKMPGWSYGIPANACGIGSILRKQSGTVCSKCYAHKGMYSFPVVQDAQARRLGILSSDLNVWRKNMTDLLELRYAKKTGDDSVFRWHDSGDIQSMAHLSAIVQIAKDIPSISFWLPTKEYSIIRKYLSKNPKGFPRNLTVRISAPMIGEKVPRLNGTVSSTVGTGTGFKCEAYARGGKCGPCRACWKRSIRSVDYPQH
jgi:hypothetical protein